MIPHMLPEQGWLVLGALEDTSASFSSVQEFLQLRDERRGIKRPESRVRTGSLLGEHRGGGTRVRLGWQEEYGDLSKEGALVLPW